ncbi:hypothetical protein LCGC14_2617770, partial [marine sediment metagenome]
MTILIGNELSGSPLYSAVVPVADAINRARLLFYRGFAPLAADADTNWVLTNARGLLLYGSLLEAATFLE